MGPTSSFKKFDKKSMEKNELVGKRYGKLTVLSFSYKNERGHSFYLCHCDCGADVVKRSDRLISGKSIGCKRCSWRRLWKPITLDDCTLIVPLTQNRYAFIDSEDFDKIKDHSWCLGPRGEYAQTNINRIPVKMHRLILDFPEQEIDHINGNSLDNRKQNLRVCDHVQNSKNKMKYKNNTSGFKGVYFSKTLNKFITYVTNNYKKIYFGMFNTAEEALIVYKNKSQELYKEFFYNEKANKIEINTEIKKGLEENEKFLAEQKEFYEKQRLLDTQVREQAKIDRKEKKFLKGIRSGKLIATSFSHFYNGIAVWNCICDCGKEKKTAWYNITRKKTRSCGCLINKNKKKIWFPVVFGEGILQIPLNKGKFALIDSDDFEKIKNYSWYCDTKGYARDRNGIMMHRVIMDCPENKEVDHKDHNVLNNIRGNLRVCTISQNQGNKFLSVRNTSGFKGVSWNKSHNRFSANIAKNGKQHFLGDYDLPEEAHSAYVNVGKILHGEFFCAGK